MKKLLAILLTLAMFATMIPVLAVGVSAEAPTYEDTWANHYDLSWFTTRKSELATTDTASNFVQLKTTENGAEVTYYYQCQGNAAGTTFYLKDAADLAGVAVLANAQTWKDTSNNTNANNGIKSCFENCTLYITADIDLSGHYWVPIGKSFDNLVGGNFIGSKGRNAESTDDEYTAITISNMTINNTDGNVPLGLFGAKTGGSIENISLKTTNITAKNFRVGSFAGQFNNATIKNCSSDAAIVTTNDVSNNVWDACGGIVGCTWGGTNGVTIENCTFTGTVTCAGDIAGGLVGTTEATMTIKGCTVNSTHISNASGNDCTGNNPYFVGVSGLVGSSRGGFTAENTTVTATVVCNAYNQRAGGMVGALPNASKVTLTNCTFNGSVTATANAGAFLGHVRNSTEANVMTYNNCTNNGTVVNTDNHAQIKFTKGTIDTATVTSLSAQKSTLEDVKAVRVVAQVKAEALTGAGFDFVVSYTNSESKTVTTKINSVELTKAFEKIMVDGTETAAAEGYVWVAFVLNNITADSITISAVANATYTDSTVYGTAGSATIALTTTTES